MNAKQITEVNKIIGHYAKIVSTDTNLIIEGELMDDDIRHIASIIYPSRVSIRGTTIFYSVK